MRQTSHTASTDHLIASLSKAYKLKSLARAGWLQSDIPGEAVESIASHSYGMALLILYLRPALERDGIQVERALEMALLHDVAESITGDITPHDRVSSLAKHEAEAAAFQEIIQHVQQGNHFRELWDEFEAGRTREAQLVKRMDKLDMLIQAYLYENQFKRRLDSFWEGMDGLFMGSESEEIYRYISHHRFQSKGS